MLRDLANRNNRGNNIVPRLAGADMARRVCEGNPRKFIQLCDQFFEIAKIQKLSPKTQHLAVMEFCDRFAKRAASVYREGFLLRTILDTLLSFLEKQFHGEKLKDVGLEIELSNDITNDERLLAAFEAGVGYSYFICSNNVSFNGLESGVKLKVANLYGALGWLPFRSGSKTMLSARSQAGQLLLKRNFLTEEDAKQAVSHVQMNLLENEPE